MRPLDQNEDPKIVTDFAAACIIPYKSNIVFSVPEKYLIYYWNGLEATWFIGEGDERNNDGCAKNWKVFQPTGLAIEFHSITYVVDPQCYCVKIFTTLGKVWNSLKQLETSIKRDYELQSLESACVLVDLVESFKTLKAFERNVRNHLQKYIDGGLMMTDYGFISMKRNKEVTFHNAKNLYLAHTIQETYDLDSL